VSWLADSTLQVAQDRFFDGAHHRLETRRMDTSYGFPVGFDMELVIGDSGHAAPARYNARAKLRRQVGHVKQ